MSSPVPSQGAPIHTLSAANELDLLGLILMVFLAEKGGMRRRDPQRLAALQARLREFEIYEASHRKAPDAELRNAFSCAVRALTG